MVMEMVMGKEKGNGRGSGRVMGAMLALITALVLLTHSTTATTTSEQKYFYIYDWPMPLRDVYPPPGAVLHEKASYDHDFYENDGFGKTLDRQQGLFATWQFSLFKNLMARLRVSEYRTLDSTKASIFIIPYDMGVHSFIGELGIVHVGYGGLDYNVYS
jgi:hypothetical protein